MNRERIFSTMCAAALMLSFLTVFAGAAYVRPKIGGDQLGHTVAPMIMPEIFFDGAGVRVVDANGLPWPVFPWSKAPVLRPLSPPNQFDPNEPWSVLIGKAYNFQYGWDSALFDEITYPTPAGSAIWIRVIKQSSKLESYYKDGGYAPLFGDPAKDIVVCPYCHETIVDSNAVSDIWMWDKRMRHNTYAVPDTFYGRLSADYEVYLGDAVTGEKYKDSNDVPIYQSSQVTLRWLRPCPCQLQGDINSDCVVDSNDLLMLADEWLTPECVEPHWCGECDLDHSSDVDIIDMALLMENWMLDCRSLMPQSIDKP